MELKKENWTKKDGIEFIKYLESLGNPDKVEWARRIINTEKRVLAIATPKIKELVKEISKGNFMSFLDLNLSDYYENEAINGFLICQIKDFTTMKKYLDDYANKIDNWANCDLMSFDVENREELFFDLVLTYIKSDKPFVRRLGLSILFKYIEKDCYLDKIYTIMNKFYKETHYYVNMMNAWLFCECFIKRREKTIEFLKTHKLNKFTINKGISKCRDSFRVSKEDKEMLIKHRQKD